jgi:type II secretory pathway component PulJ
MTIALHNWHSSKPRSARAAAGFTLPELLIAGIIAAGIAVITSQVLINQILTGRRIELTQRIRENTSRFNYLVQIEASEASEIGQAIALTGCEGGGASVFTFFVPRDQDTYASQTNRSEVHYYNNNGSIWRCGPPVTRNGVLIHGREAAPQDPVSGIVIRNATLQIDNCDDSNERQVAFRVVFPDGNAGDQANCVLANARSVFVCNPPIDPADPQLGDCT